MQISSPRPKKYNKIPPNLQIPVILKKDNTTYKIKGIFNGFSVYVDSWQDMKNVVSMGYFGKGNFSRSYPQFNDEKSEILRMRQYLRRTKWSEKDPSKNKHLKKVITVPDSDDEFEDYFTNLIPTYRIDKSELKEVVCLSLEEAFFLLNSAHILEIYNNNLQVLNSDKMWASFAEIDPYFPYNYLVYSYLRSKNWIVKPGIKFGGDFLLYKQGPPFFHASCLVIVDVLNKNQERIRQLSRRSMDNTWLVCLNRLCETAGKELMICQVILDEDCNVNYNNLQAISIKEVLINRCTTNP